MMQQFTCNIGRHIITANPSLTLSDVGFLDTEEPVRVRDGVAGQ